MPLAYNADIPSADFAKTKSFWETNMKQRCILSKKKNSLAIKELAQTEPGAFSILYETEFDNTIVKEAIKDGHEAVIRMFRTRHFYPHSSFTGKIAAGIISMFTEDPVDKLQVEFNDLECLQRKTYEDVEKDKIENEKELAEIDNLLEDDDTFDIEIDATPAGNASKVNIDDAPEA